MEKKTFLFVAFLFAFLHFCLASAPVFSTTTVPNGQYGSGYNVTLKVTGGKSPYKFSISTGTLPQGITLSSAGVLSGTATAAGSYSFSVAVQDNTKNGDGGPQTATQKYTLVISPVALKITANDATMPYGGPLPTLGVSYSGFVNKDDASDLSVQPTITTTATVSSLPGMYPITASGAADANYTITYSPGTLTIGGATLYVTANPQTKQYGSTDPALTYTVTGFRNGDNTSLLTGSLSRVGGENVGSYPITRGSLSAGGGYTINFTGNYLTITQISQHIDWGQSLVIGCNGTTQVQLTATASSGLPVTYTVSNPGVATVSGNVLTLLHQGTAVVTATQGGSGNVAPAAAVTDTLVYQPASLIQQHFSDAIYFDNSSGDYVAWQWYKNGDSIAGATQPYYTETPDLNGNYYVIATNKAGQRVQSCALSITGGEVPAGIKVQPNPVAGGARATVTCNYSATALQGAVLQIVDINGRVRQQIGAVQPSTEVTIPSDPGIYIITLQLASGQKASTNVLVTN